MDIERYKEIYRQRILGERSGSDKFIQLKDKETIVRILPPKEGQDFYFEHGYHYIHKQRYYCPRFTLKKPCPICEFISKLYNTKNEADIQTAKEIKLIKRYYYNAFVRTDDDSKIEVKLLSMGVKFWEKTMRWVVDEEIGDFTDTVRGYDIKIVKEDAGGWTNYDNSELSRKMTPIHPDPKIAAEILNSRYDLTVDIIGEIYSYAELVSVLEGNDPRSESKSIADISSNTVAAPVVKENPVVKKDAPVVKENPVVKEEVPVVKEETSSVEDDVAIDGLDEEELRKFEEDLKRQLEGE